MSTATKLPERLTGAYFLLEETDPATVFTREDLSLEERQIVQKLSEVERKFRTLAGSVLPEAQVDRFMLKVRVSYPTKAEELEIIDRMTRNHQVAIERLATTDHILQARALIGEVIAGRYELTTGRRGHRVHFSDDRLWVAHDGFHQPRTLREQRAKIREALIGFAAMRGHFLQVVAGTERRPRTGQNDGTDVFVVGRFVERELQRAHERFGEGVARFGPIKGEREHAVLESRLGIADDREIHEVLLRLLEETLALLTGNRGEVALLHRGGSQDHLRRVRAHSAYG
mgnify:CR=1 FL=1